MAFHGFARLVRWSLFAFYLSLFFIVPLGLLWNGPGLALGLAVSLAFLGFLRFRGSPRISKRLNVKPLSQAQAPKVFAVVHEYCRRLAMPIPQLGIIETPALNLAVYGFAERNYHLVVTRGLMNALTREQLSALLGRGLSYLWYRDVFNESWLSQFLALVDLAIAPSTEKAGARRLYPYQWIVRQLLIYPLTLIPTRLLMTRRRAMDLDLKSVRITRKPVEFADGLRLIEAMQERIPFHVPLSSRHLFLLPPPSLDPIGRVFFENLDMKERILQLSRLIKPLPLTACLCLLLHAGIALAPPTPTPTPMKKHGGDGKEEAAGKAKKPCDGYAPGAHIKHDEYENLTKKLREGFDFKTLKDLSAKLDKEMTYAMSEVLSNLDDKETKFYYGHYNAPGARDFRDGGHGMRLIIRRQVGGRMISMIVFLKWDGKKWAPIEGPDSLRIRAQVGPGANDFAAFSYMINDGKLEPGVYQKADGEATHKDLSPHSHVAGCARCHARGDLIADKEPLELDDKGLVDGVKLKAGFEVQGALQALQAADPGFNQAAAETGLRSPRSLIPAEWAKQLDGRCKELGK